MDLLTVTLIALGLSVAFIGLLCFRVCQLIGKLDDARNTLWGIRKELCTVSLERFDLRFELQQAERVHKAVLIKNEFLRKDNENLRKSRDKYQDKAYALGYRDDRFYG